jgi:hypothetical protein
MHGDVQAMNTNIDKMCQKTHLCLKEKTETLQTCLNLDNNVKIIGRQVLQLHNKSDLMSAHYTNLEKQIEDLGRNARCIICSNLSYSVALISKFMIAIFTVAAVCVRFVMFSCNLVTRLVVT